MTESGNRDHLSAERTHLANERTLLAYVRTALALVAGGAAILQLYPSHDALRLAAWALVAGGAFMVVVGLLRFMSVRRSISGN
jgi:putative membrane protein